MLPKTIAIAVLTPHEVMNGFVGRFVHTESQTLSFWEVAAGAVLPLHQHMHQQTTLVTSGTFELCIAGVCTQFTPGMLAVIPPNTLHSGKAITNCTITDIFFPVRADYQALDK